MPVRHYVAIVEGDTASGYSVFFPDLPGCTSGGATLQEAALHAEEALAGHLALMLESGEAVPAPSTLDALPRPIEPDVVEAARLLVRFPPERSGRKDPPPCPPPQGGRGTMAGLAPPSL